MRIEAKKTTRNDQKHTAKDKKRHKIDKKRPKNDKKRQEKDTFFHWIPGRKPKQHTPRTGKRIRMIPWKLNYYAENTRIVRIEDNPKN